MRTTNKNMEAGMKRLGGLAISVLLIAAPLSTAYAADMAVKAPPPPVAAPFSWTGFYIGGNVGGAWGRDSVSSAECSPGAFAIDCAAVSAATSPSLRPSGFTGGGQIGYNWQTGNTVFGLEADFDYMGLRASQGGTFPFPSTLPGGPAGPPTTFFSPSTSVSTDWLFTARPRIGWVANNALFYATGGLAVTNQKFNQTLVLLPPFVDTSTASTTRAGWAVGGGVELALNQKWSIKGEYLYADFGSIGSAGVLTPASPGLFLTNSAHLTVSIARLGLNYRLN